MPDSSTVTLTESQQDIINRLIESGSFQGRDEVISAGLHLLEDRNRAASEFIARLESDVLEGLQSGPALPMETSEELLKIFRQRH